jgi:hypothetical protein
MANKSNLFCGKQVYQIGENGSISDYKNRLYECFKCSYFVTCTKSQEYFKGIMKQQDLLSKM